MEETVLLCDAIICDVDRSGNAFSAWSTGTQITYRCHHTESFLPIERNDLLRFATVRGTAFDGSVAIDVVGRPLVLVGRSLDAVTDRLCSGCKRVGRSFGLLMAGLARRLSLENGCELDTYISTEYEQLAFARADALESHPLTGGVVGLDPSYVLTLLAHWYKTTDVRSLYLLNLNHRDIVAARDHENRVLTPRLMLQALLDNPLRVLSLPIDQCLVISALLRLQEPTPDELSAANIARLLAAELKSRGSAGMPSGEFVSRYRGSGELGPVLAILSSVYGVCLDMGTVYLPHTFRSEKRVATSLARLLSPLPPIQEGQADHDRLPAPQFASSCLLTDEQKGAIAFILDHRVSCLNAAAGTGKSTLLRELCANLEASHVSYVVLSFTGKAVLRIWETAGVMAHTIHRFIKVLVPTLGTALPRVVIIDESSMVPIELFDILGESLGWSCRFVLIGDVNQLPPISWGALFRGLVRSVPTTSLLTNHRQLLSERDSAADNSNRSLAWLCGAMARALSDRCKAMPPLVASDDVAILPGGIPQLTELVSQMVRVEGYDPRSITIVTPTSAAANEINRSVQHLLTGRQSGAFVCATIDANGSEWNTGDRVMLTANDYELCEFNGSEGYITSIDVDASKTASNSVTVLFANGVEASFKTRKPTLVHNLLSNDLAGYRRSSGTTDSLILSYAVTVHRAQGSQAPHVIFYVPPAIRPSPYFFHSGLVYTALTRAQSKLWIVGNVAAAQQALHTRPSCKVDNFSDRIALALKL